MKNEITWKATGFFSGQTDIEDAMRRLSGYLQSIPDVFKKFSSEELLHKPSPGKWSKQEILGHLIDSAINNLKRFTEIQFLPQPYIITSYQQDELVNVNHYQQLSLDHLLNLWAALNQQIIYVVKNIPAEKFNYAVNPQYDNNEIKTLGWVICDYTAHMEHHVKQSGIEI
jgi:hypothetical protein